MPTIELLFKDKSIENFQIGGGDTLLIGRNNVNDIVIDNLAVSAQHAKIESIGNEFLFVDLQSENGSFVNERHIKSHWLSHGDVVTIGKHTLKFSNSSNHNQDKIKVFGNTKTMQIDTKRFRELIDINRKSEAIDGESIQTRNPDLREEISVLSFLTGKKDNIQLNAKMIRIGKDPESDIVIKSLLIGKTAAVVNQMSDGWYINYVGGISKLRINNKVMKKTVKLNNLDIITIGSTKLQFLVLHSADLNSPSNFL